jgi:hypothetical protein
MVQQAVEDGRGDDALPINGTVANLVDEEQLRLRQDLQALVEAALGQRLAEGPIPVAGAVAKRSRTPCSRALKSSATATCVARTLGVEVKYVVHHAALGSLDQGGSYLRLACGRRRL